MRTVIGLLLLAIVTAGCTTTDLSTSTNVGPATSTTESDLTTTTEESTTGPLDPQSRWITIDGTRFIDTRSGETFVPRGVNLLRKGSRGDQIFVAYDPEWVSAELDAVASLGYNTVRFFLDLCRACATTQEGVTDDYLDSLTDFLSRLAERGLVALPTSNDVPDRGYSERLPCCEPFGGYRNSLYLTAEGHEIAAEYFTDLISGLRDREAPLHAVLGWQLANEHFFLRDVPPISLTEGSVTTADGRTYDLSEDTAVAAMVENNLRHYISTVGAAIRSEQPDALVTMGFFPPEDPHAGRATNDNRWVIPSAMLEESELDFIDLHAYPGLGGTWEGIVPAFGLDRIQPQIPVILGEFGAFSAAFEDPETGAAALARWQADSCVHGFGGWLLWLWGSPVDGEVITAVAGDRAIGLALSPQIRPDPCDVGDYVSNNLALDRPTSASQEESGEYASRWAVDGSAGTWWSANDGPPQWIEIDLGEDRGIGRVEILVGLVTPKGPQTHEIYLRRDGETGRGPLAGRVSADAQLDDVLTVAVDPAVEARYVRVQTTSMDGWVILHEISVFAP